MDELTTHLRTAGKWARPALFFFAVLTLLWANASCKKSGVGENQNAAATNVNGAVEETFATPPFGTKEPERYQAVRVVSTTDDSGPVETRATTIARDGARRREDYETAAGTLSLLELPDGSYLLLPAKKLYAEWRPDEVGAAGSEKFGAEPVLPPDKLLNEVRPQTSYEKLGSESINGRAVTKYRVNVRGQTGTAKEAPIESLIWVDESFGMPVKSETSMPGGPRVLMELRDIRETVDPQVFELPTDYRKVDAREIYTQVRPAGAGAKP